MPFFKNKKRFSHFRSNILSNGKSGQESDYNGAKLTAAMQSLMGGSGSAITIDVTGENLNEIEETASAIQENIKDIDGIEKLETVG